MTIAKGFLRRRVEVNKQLLIQGAILWITISYVLYAFLYMFREAFRILTGFLGGRVLLVLSENESFIYNLFYASIAVSIGFMFSLNYVLNNLQWRHPARTRFYIKRALNEEGFLKWSFLLWFGKVTSMLGVWYMIYPLQFDIDFLKEFPHFLILLPIIMFISTWPSIRPLLGRGSIKSFGVLFGLFLIMSLLFSFKNFLNMEKVNHNLRSNSVEYSYNLTVPRSESQQALERRHLIIDFYVVCDSNNISKPKIFLHDARYQIETEEIGEYLSWEKDKLDESERDQIEVNLHIDEDIQMSSVNDIKYEFRKSGIRMIQYSTGAKHSKYPSTHPLFKNLGIHQMLYPWYPEFTPFLDSAENLDPATFSIRLPESTMYRIKVVEQFNRVEIKIDKEMAWLNGKLVKKDELHTILYSYMEKYAPDFVVIFSPSSDISYGRYIEYLDIIHSVIDKLRDEMSIKLYNKLYYDLSFAKERDTIRIKLPNNILEWTSEEKRLAKLINQSNKR